MMLRPADIAMAVRQAASGSATPSPKATPSTATLWPATASQRSRIRVSSLSR
jgi:hypothetical protein